MAIIGTFIKIDHDSIIESENGELVIPAGTKLEITNVSAICDGEVMLSVRIKEEN